MTNPVFGSNQVFKDPVQRRGRQVGPQTPVDPSTLENMYAMPSATAVQTGRLTYDDVIVKAGGLIALLVVVAGLTWVATPTMPALWIVGAVVGFVLALVNIFKKTPSPALITAYTVAEGMFLGGLSAILNAVYPGVAMQALVATVVTFGVVLVGFRSGKLRTSPKLTRIFMIAMLSYFAFSLVNVGIMIFGSSDAAWGLRSSVSIGGIPLGVVIGVLAVLLASYSLVMDFEAIERGVVQGAPRSFAWTAAFGLIVTLVWLYTEFLRIFALLSGRD